MKTHAKRSEQLAIVGSGPAGLGAADAAALLGFSYSIFEAQSKAFGHCKSFSLKSLPQVFFDEGPHISFTKNHQVQELFAKSAVDFHLLQPKMLNYWRGLEIPHPPQSHLYKIPEELKKSVAEGLGSRPGSFQEGVPKNTTENYYEWLLSNFGKAFVDLFPEVYTRKYWTVSAKEMTTDWIGERIHRPSVEDMLATLSGPKESATGHYFSHFRYPKKGGFESFLRLSLNEHKKNVEFNSAIQEIDLDRKKLVTSSGKILHFDHLISSVPLDKIVHLIPGIAQKYLHFAEQLKVTSVTLYSLVYHSEVPPPAHWMYIYDQDIPFARLYFPKALLNDQAVGLQALQVEVYSSPYRSREQSGDNIDRVIKALEKMKLLQKKDIVESDERHISHANVLFDHHREPARGELLQFLESKGVTSVGRFGNWAYLWSDESYLQGQQAVKQLTEKRGL